MSPKKSDPSTSEPADTTTTTAESDTTTSGTDTGSGPGGGSSRPYWSPNGDPSA